jgi:nucleoid-associated protein
MAIKKLIMHWVNRPSLEVDATAQLRQDPLSVNETLESFIWKLNTSYNAKSGKIYGSFEKEEDGFAPLLKSYMMGTNDFLNFTQATTESLCTSLNQSNQILNAYMIYVHYEVLETEYLLILQLNSTQTLMVDDELSFKDAFHLDAAKLQLGARINLTDWSSSGESNYISLARSRAGKTASEYFRQWLGCTEELDAKKETAELLTRFNQFCADDSVPAEQISEYRKKTFEYCQQQAEAGEHVSVSELSKNIDESAPSKFTDYLNSSDVPFKKEVPADKAGLKTLIRYSGSAKGISLSFSESLLGKEIAYDADSDTMTIKGIPPTLRKQLLKNNY